VARPLQVQLSLVGNELLLIFTQANKDEGQKCRGWHNSSCRDMDDNVKQAMRHSDYTVGWLCALPTEMAAAKAMLDEVHPSLAEQDPQDHNSYCLGRIARHNIVIASLPAGWYGETPAATVAKDMLRTFKSIRFGLLVGIGGAVPSASHDIRLGDVVISQPTARHGGVIQYDRGKVSQGGRFQQTGVLNSPPVVLLTALSRLQADHDTGDSQVPRYLSRMFEERPKMLGKYGHQGIHNDCLFHADYEHHDLAADCSQCDRGRAVERQRRIDIDPVFHYGTIASGNCVIKDGTTRDELRKEHDVLCFEMEAAGIMQEFPCLVIRGICDYADSHKNKAWQGYAAATASAFAKELLSLVLPATVLHQPPVAQLVTG
jgi:nucleoside phosphorylase